MRGRHGERVRPGLHVGRGRPFPCLPPMTGGAPHAKLLEVSDVVVRFGGIVALDGVSFDLEEGQILGLIGPNGAGKTTLFNCLSRLYTPVSGDIRFEGRSLLDRPSHRIAEIGIGANLPEYRAVRAAIGARQCTSRRRTRTAAATSSATRCAYPGCAGRRRRPMRRSGRCSHMLDLEDVALRPAGGLAARHPQAGRTGAGARRPAQAAAARRAGRRAQP